MSPDASTVKVLYTVHNTVVYEWFALCLYKLSLVARGAAAVHNEKFVGACVDNYVEQLLVRAHVKISVVLVVVIIVNIHNYLGHLLPKNSSL